MEGATSTSTQGAAIDNISIIMVIPSPIIDITPENVTTNSTDNATTDNTTTDNATAINSRDSAA